MGDLYHLPVFILHLGEFHVRVAENRVSLIRITADFGGIRQQFFHLLGQNMGLQAQGILQIDPILLQIGTLLIEVFQLCRLQFQNLRGDEGDAALDAGHDAGEALAHLLVGVVGGILIAETGHIYAQVVQLAVQGGLLSKDLQQALRAVADMALPARQLPSHLLGQRQVGFPGLPGLVHQTQVPGVLRGHLVPCG